MLSFLFYTMNPPKSSRRNKNVRINLLDFGNVICYFSRNVFV